MKILISKNGGKITLYSKDDGIGVPKIIYSNGLTGMKERVSEVGGEINIYSEPNQGFTVNIDIPIITEHDIVLMDIKMPRINGIDAILELKEQNKLTPTILLTTFDDDELFLKGMRAGAKGFLLKDVSIETLADTIRKVVIGETVIRPAITERIINKIKNTDYNFESIDTPEKLTKRETEILRLMAGGYSNKEISSVLCITEGVVKNYTSSIFFKLGVRDRTRAVLKAIELGLI